MYAFDKTESDRGVKRALIVAAAPESETAYIRALYDALGRPFVICADGGIAKTAALEIPCDLHIGDMDSGAPGGAAQTVRLPREKNVSDTHACLEQAVARGFDSLYVCGAGGGRLDHTLFGVLLLEEYADRARVEWHDARSVAMLARSGRHTPPDGYPYVSIVPLDAWLVGVSITGVKYPLYDVRVRRGDTLTLSNEPLDRAFCLDIRSGAALLVFSRD